MSKQEEAFLSRFLRIALLVVEDHADRPSDGERLRDIEARVTADMHDSLEETHRGAVARVQPPPLIQCRTVGDINPSFEQIGTFLQGLIAFEDKLLVAVTDNGAISIILSILVKKNVVAGFDTTVNRPSVLLDMV